MKRIVLVVLVLMVTLLMSAQSHNYLLHTQYNVERLKKQIKNDSAVNMAWKVQLDRANELVKRSNLAAQDCQELGLAYRITGDKKYAQALKNILMDYSSRDTWEGADLLNRNPPWKGGLPTSHTGFYISIGYDCAYDYLTAIERKLIAKGIVRVCINPLKDNWLDSGDSFHTFDTMGHNWWSACVYMAGFASLAIQNEIPEAKQWAVDIAKTITEWVGYTGSVLQNKPRNFDRSGGFYESVNYASYGISQYLLFRLAFNNCLPEIEQPKVDQLNKIADFFIHTTYYTNDEGPMSVNFGDSSIRKNGNAVVLLLWNLGFQKDDYAWYLQRVNSGKDKEGLQLNTPNGLILHPDMPILPADYKPTLSKSQLFADIGWATMRSSWENDATFVAVKSGLTWNHTHADAGSFIVFHNGKYLIIDAGNSSYGNPLYTQYYCQSEAHNVVLFNDKGQDRNDPYFGVVNRGALYNMIDGGDFKYLLADATGPYSRFLKRNYRSFIWAGDVLLVIDDLLAYEPGQFQWLLHYNGVSKRRGLDLSIKDGDAEVLVRPLFPETFPNGGLPHDFPEKMRLDEKSGYEDHHPENKKSYWAISHFEQTSRTKFISAITFKTDENKDNLPVIERFEGDDFIGVRITQNGKTIEVYLNLLADGRIKHRNSVIEMNGWQTDAYLSAITYNEGENGSDISNINDLFIGHGSYLRRDGKVLMHALSKYSAYIKNFNDKQNMIFQGQPDVTLSIYSAAKSSSVNLNRKTVKGVYDPNTKLLKVRIISDELND
ncbi:heparinase II/III domain-containing protein [Geofilum sp. OHC36d9]|uniref:heparinase II/III domain-containing protein n=1 Tax=Geofilum sp. OHC36d9 TaxID=3458413 RepID=UPI00403451DB